MALVRGRWVITSAHEEVLSDGAVLVDGRMVLRDGMPTLLDLEETGRSALSSRASRARRWCGPDARSAPAEGPC